MKINICILFLSLYFNSWGQNKNEQNLLRSNNYRYDIDLLPKEFHAGRRTALRNKLPEKSVAVFFSNPVQNRSADTDYEYHQDPNFYYLCGHSEPNAVLLIFKETQIVNDKSFNEILFLQERIPSKELWNGRILGTEEALKILGIQTILANSEFQNFPFSFEMLNSIFVTKLKTVEKEEDSSTDLYSLQNRLLALLGKAGENKLQSKPLTSIMSQLREVKGPEEIELMRKAVNISCKAHLELIKSLHNCMSEYQAQSIVEFVFKNEGAESCGYPSIVGSSENSCVLHYTSNRKKLNDEHLLLIDAGAEYHGYTADITRTLPVDGTFSNEEKAIYTLVLNAQEAGIKACKAGNSFYSTHAAAVKVIKEGLLKLGIISSENEYANYFMHGTSHYLGLDAHDLSTRANLQPGNIITVEPGIYIPEGSPCDKKWWNIGVRIEDDILITSTEPDNLSGTLTRNIEEIERLMKEKGLFEKKD